MYVFIEKLSLNYPQHPLLSGALLKNEKTVIRNWSLAQLLNTSCVVMQLFKTITSLINTTLNFQMYHTLTLLHSIGQNSGVLAVLKAKW